MDKQPGGGDDRPDRGQDQEEEDQGRRHRPLLCSSLFSCSLLHPLVSNDWNVLPDFQLLKTQEIE